LIHAADIASSDGVLDVGCATGYGAAVLARLAGQVTALEQDAGLAQAARTALGAQSKVSVVAGPLTAGWPQGGPYDVIVLEGATEVVPQAYLSQLKEGGRLVCVLGSAPAAKAMLYCRSGDDLGGRPIFDATAALLPGFVKAPAFAF
jgi:protein-L-isoaspartate(D-aspartate) O-methyltransferase